MRSRRRLVLLLLRLRDIRSARDADAVERICEFIVVGVEETKWSGVVELVERRDSP